MSKKLKFSRFERQSVANRWAAFFLDWLAYVKAKQQPAELLTIVRQTVLGQEVVLLTLDHQEKADAQTQVSSCYATQGPEIAEVLVLL